MKQKEIVREVVKYMAEYKDQLSMPEPKYHVIRPPADPDGTRGKARIIKGTSADIVADLMEKDDFYADWTETTSPANAKIALARKGMKVYGEFELAIIQEGIVGIDTPSIKQKDYIDKIRSREDFLRAGELVGIMNIDAVVDRLYGSK